MKRFNAASLVTFYQEVIDSTGTIEFLSEGGWEAIGFGPCPSSFEHVWRINPSKETTDREYALENTPWWKEIKDIQLIQE